MSIIKSSCKYYIIITLFLGCLDLQEQQQEKPRDGYQELFQGSVILE